MPTFIGSRGRIFHDSWRPGGPARGAVVLLHGYGEQGSTTRLLAGSSPSLRRIGPEG